MEIDLTTPETHSIIESENSHIPGSVSISSLAEITVQLLQYISQGNEHKKRLFRRAPSHTVQNALVQQTIHHAPDRIDSRRTFNFSLPIPGDIPATASTPLGSISYAITATANGSVQHSPIKIQRLSLPIPITHTRRYPDRITTDLTVTRRSSQKRTYQLNWLARSTVQHTNTSSQYLVAKQLRWRVDETVKCTGQDGLQRTQTLCRGQRTGPWMARDKDESIAIPFEICLRKAVSDVSLEHLTVEHSLYIEVVTGEDTVHRHTGELIDRRVRDKVYRGVFTLPVTEVADSTVLDQVYAVTAPPVYQELDSLPAYEW
ncbi:hypothetical protein BDV18DRAFT_160134 [Aspergillus unguis]